MLRKLLTRVQRLDGQPLLVEAASALRRRLPGDGRYGDALSTAGDEPAHQLGRRLSALTRSDRARFARSG